MLYLHVSGSSNPVCTTGNTDRTAFHPYFSFKLRRMAYYYMCEFYKFRYYYMCLFYKFTELSLCSKSPGLGKAGNPELNRACLEKVNSEMKMLILGLSVRVIMVKAILPKINCPVPSSKGDFLSTIEKMICSSLPGFEGLTKGTKNLHLANSLSKDKS